MPPESGSNPWSLPCEGERVEGQLYGGKLHGNPSIRRDSSSLELNGSKVEPMLGWSEFDLSRKGQA